MVSSGVPTVPLAYSRKFAGVFDSLGYPHVVDLRTASEEEATERVLEAFRRREALREEVRIGTARAKERLRAYEALVRTCLDEVAQESR